MNGYETLIAAAAVAGSDVALAGAIDGVAGVNPTGPTDKPRRIVSICGDCGSNVGYIAVRINGLTVAVIDMATLTALVSPLPLDIPLTTNPLAVAAHSTTGTDAVRVVLGYQEAA